MELIGKNITYKYPSSKKYVLNNKWIIEDN